MTIFDADMTFFEYAVLGIGVFIVLQLFCIGLGMAEIKGELDQIRDDTFHLRPVEPEPDPGWYRAAQDPDGDPRAE